MTSVYTAFLLIFLTAVVAIYALIQSRKNYVLLFLLTPFILISSVFSGSVIYSLQGTPISGIPDYEVEVLWVEMAKPDIFFMVRNLEAGGAPKYYRIDYNDPNKKKMSEMQEAMEQGKPVEGKFKIVNGGDSKSDVEVIDFNLPEVPPEEQKPQNNNDYQPILGGF